MPAAGGGVAHHALAFTRSPMVTAVTAREIQRASRGRSRLGLGAQVKAHNERRFSVPSVSPVPKLAEQVRALRAIFDAFAGATLDFTGDFYRFDLLPDFYGAGWSATSAPRSPSIRLHPDLPGPAGTGGLR